jgi:hypothetical protein
MALLIGISLVSLLRFKPCLGIIMMTRSIPLLRDNHVYAIAKWSNPKYANAKRLFPKMPSDYNFLFRICHPPLENIKLPLTFLPSLTWGYKNDRVLCKYQNLILFENLRKFTKHICIGKFLKIHILVFFEISSILFIFLIFKLSGLLLKFWTFWKFTKNRKNT